MLTYRAHIYTLAMEASGAAVGLGLSLSRCVSLPRGPDRDVRLSEEMPDIERQSAALENAVTELLSALPKEVSGSVTRGDQGLLRHLRLINRRVRERLPTACAGDACDIAAQDIPEVLRYFDAWHERQSPAYSGLVERVTPLISGNLIRRSGWRGCTSRPAVNGGRNGLLKKPWLSLGTKAHKMARVSGSGGNHDARVIGPP